MRKPVFSLEEARRVAWETPPPTFAVQLHDWTGRGALVRLKKGVYGFSDLLRDKVDVARALYGPAYISLEYALNAYGLLPDVIFAMTLVTTRITRRFTTPLGDFFYHKIKPSLFWGYDSSSLMGEREKVIVDYLYLYSGRLVPSPDFWETLRWQNLGEVDFRKARGYAKRFHSKKVVRLIESLEVYGKG